MKGQISVPHILFKPDCKLNTLSSILTSERRGDIHIDQRLHYCHSSASSPFIIPALADLTHGSHTHTKKYICGSRIEARHISTPALSFEQGSTITTLCQGVCIDCSVVSP